MSVRGFPCLMYHHISTHSERSEIKPKYCLPPVRFSAQLSRLRERRAVVRDMLDLLCRKRNNEDLPPRYCIITFDDGHESNLWAAEEMMKYGYRATFFVVKEWCRNYEDYLTAQQLIRIREMGHSIGVHGKTHRWWTMLDDPDLQGELLETKAWLEDVLQERIELCAAPGGKIDSRVRRVIRDCGFAMWGTSRSGMNRAAGVKQEINRIGVRCNDSITTFMGAVTGDRLLYFRRRMRQVALWLPKYILKR